ncbi:MAG: glutamate-cysteine ligase family protein [Polyangiales bacterium]
MTAAPESDRVITSEDDLLEVFQKAFRPEARFVGIEAEKFGIFEDGRPLRYHDEPGRPGVETLFRALSSRYGWTPEAEKPGGPPLSLLRGATSITLEPGSQFELSGSPCADVHAVLAEVETHRAELASLTEAQGLHWVGLGFNPIARQEDLDWVPKSRYPVMRAYFPTRGTRGLEMMRRTATVQANFDFSSEGDAMRKLRAGLAASVIATALFASSQVVEGVRRPIASHRAWVWLDTDNDRAGLLPFAWKPDARLGDYVRHALDVPMFIVKRDGAAIDATRHTFRRFLADGIEGHRATMADWESHLKTLFPEARLQKTLEVRGADSVPARWSMALPALWLGLLYDDEALDFIDARLVPIGHDAWAEARAKVAAEGLRAAVAGTTVGALANELLAVADAALARRARRDAAGRDERVYLAPLIEAAARGQSIGDVVLGDWSHERPGALAALLERAAY